MLAHLTLNTGHLRTSPRADLDEQAFRFNERDDEDGDRGRFLKAIVGIVGKRLTWAKLTAENDGLPAEA